MINQQGYIFHCFICLWFYFALTNFSLICTRHHCQWRIFLYVCSALIGQRSVGIFSIPHLLWHEVSVYNGNLRSTHTCCLAFVQWSCHYLFLILRTVAVGIRPTTFCMWGGRSNRLRHRGGCLFWDLHGANKNVMYFDPVQFFFHWQVAKSITLNFNFNTSDQSNKEEKLAHMVSNCITFNSCVWRQHFAISMVDIKIYFVHTIFIKSNAVRHVKPFLYTNFGYRFLRLPDLDYWHTVGVICQPGILTPRHLIPPLVYPRVHVCHLDCEIDNDSV